MRCGLCGIGSQTLLVGNHAALADHDTKSNVSEWTRHYRALYRVGHPSDVHLRGHDKPRLSGVERLTQSEPMCSVVLSHDENTLPVTVHISGSHPPSSALSIEEAASHAWGFVFHESCWKILGQAYPLARLEPASDTTTTSSSPSASSRHLLALWRILTSVPCTCDVPNWGHNYGGLFVRTRLRSSRPVNDNRSVAAGFVLLDRPSAILVASPYYDPFDVPELSGRLAQLRAKPERTDIPDEREPQAVVDDDDEESRSTAGTQSQSQSQLTEQQDVPASPLVESEQLSKPDESMEVTNTRGGQDPFSGLPVEIREQILAFIPCAPDVNSLRLASPAVADVSLSQSFFRSRFWLGSDLDVMFDGFLVPNSSRGRSFSISGSSQHGALDWRALYHEVRLQMRQNRCGIGEKNRRRIWSQTARPLAKAMQAVSQLGVLKGAADYLTWQEESKDTWEQQELQKEQYGGEWPEDREDPGGHPLLAGDGNEDEIESDASERRPAPGWRIIATMRYGNPTFFGEAQRQPFFADVKLPTPSSSARLTGVAVSFIEFFEQSHITGLRFEYAPVNEADPSNTYELGYFGTRAMERTLHLEPPPPRGDESQDNDPESAPPPFLTGIAAVKDACGFRALALLSGQHMESEYLAWVGETEGDRTMSTSLVKTKGGQALTRIRAAFDGFRMQALMIPGH